MTLKILLIRHGETDGNLKGFVQNADTPLNTVGKNQANLLYEELDKRNISRILSSDYLRARQTIENFVGKKNIPCSWSPILRERDFGLLKGKFYKDINSAKVFEESFSPPGGENLPQFEKRIDSAWNEILKVSYSLRGELAIVTHGLVIKDFLKRKLFLDKSISSKYEIVPNTSITIFEPIYPFNVEEFASIKHLKSSDINKGIA